jgi:hypothetical protein
MKDNSPRHWHLEYANKSVWVFCDINVDGAQMFKMGVKQAIPILARVTALVNDRGEHFLFSTMPVFKVANFLLGKEKVDADELLEWFANELVDRHPGRGTPDFQVFPSGANPPDRLVDSFFDSIVASVFSLNRSM